MAAGQHEQALKSLRFVYAQTKDPRILISIGRAYLRISNPVEASRNCRLAKTFLARDSDLLRLADKCIEESQNATVALKSPSASFQRAANNSPMTTGRTPPARINENKQSLAISMTQNAQQLIQYPSEKQPIHRRWWFWTGIATTVVAGVVVGTALTLNARRPNWPDAVVLMPQ